MRRMQLAVMATGLLALLGAPWPDDWDAVGFVLAVTDFDLGTFQPHPPGYPVYVALARVFHALGCGAVSACTLASALGGGLCVAAVARSFRTGPWCVLVLASPTLVLAATSARSDALGVGLCALGAALAIDRPFAASVLLALALGARPSALALVVPALVLTARPWAPGAIRRTAGVCGIFAVVCLTWGVGLLLAVGGPARYLALARVQATGHFTAWGASAWTHPDASVRATSLAHGLLGAGLGLGHTPWGAARALGWTVLVAMGLRSMGARRAGALAALVLPYTAWVALAQNPDAPRHLLPLVLALTAVAGEGCASVRTSLAHLLGKVPVAGLTLLLAMLLAWPAGVAGWVHRTRSPAAVQAAGWVRQQSAGRSVMVFGGRAARVISWAGVPAMPRTWLGEVDVTLEGMDRLPSRVWLTDEVLYRDRGMGAVRGGRRFCRDVRVDGAGACVTVFTYDVLAYQRH